MELGNKNIHGCALTSEELESVPSNDSLSSEL